MASSSEPKTIYHVFLSFRGTDVRNNFLGHLYKALDLKGIYTYIDSKELRKGEQIELALMKAIKKSQVAIIVFSENYASSSWCLEEVAKIMECKEERDLKVFPVFYKVEPREVRTPREKYREAMVRHEFKFGKNSEKVKRWEKALFNASSLSGWHLKDRDESEFIQRIVTEISTRLDRKLLHVALHPVGIDSQVVKLKSMLNLESNDNVLMVGLWGKGGIGKTTLAKAIYNEIFNQFEYSCFLANVREVSKDCKDLVTLQEKLLLEILALKERLVVSNVDRGINLRLCHKRVFLILDDVNDLRQLHALVGEGKWFRNGSRIMITTKDSHLLNYLGIDQDHVYEVKELVYSDARELFSKHAFPTHQNFKIKTYLVDSVLNHAKGLPLALEVLGAFLCGRREREWESALDKISTVPTKGINDVLKISYNGLEPNVKEIFLHIACFYKGWNSEYVKEVLHCFDLHEEIGLKILIERSLIRIEFGNIQMHDLIQLMGMDIVNQESNDPGRRSRLWLQDDIIDVLSSNMENCAMKAIALGTTEPIEICVDPEAFTKMRKLRLLILRNVHNTFQGPICLPNELRWLQWDGGAPHIPKFSSGPKKLVGLHMRNCTFQIVPSQFKDFQNLEYINFSGCESLVCTPDLSCTPNLKELDLQFCKSLVEAHKSSADHDKLEKLNLKGCSKLSIFPNELRAKHLKILNLAGCTKFERFPNIPHKLKDLRVILLGGTAIIELPASIENLVSLKHMGLHECKKLATLPSSIYKLRLIENLILSGCTNFIMFPKFENSADSRMKVGLLNLMRLNLEGCSLCELEFLENFLCFPFLRELCLGLNNNISITGLPTSITNRRRLRVLRLTNCHHITALPPFLRYFFTDNSESLQRNGDLTLIHYFVRRGLTMARISSINQIPPKVHIILHGGDMPEWVLPIEDGFASFMASKDLYDKFLGLVFCFVIDNGKKKRQNRPMIEILPQVNGEWRDGKGEEDYLRYSGSTLDRIWFWYFTPNELWGEVKFGQIDGSYVQFSLIVRTMEVKKWGLRIICKPLEDDLKVKIQENRLINPALLREVVLESIYSEVESLFLHEDSSSEEDQQGDLLAPPMSYEELWELSLMKSYQRTLPQGMQTPVQPPEVQSPTHSGEQTSARTSSVGDSIADEPEPEPIKNPSATGSGAASALTSATTPTTSTASMPSHGAAETVNLPSAKPSTVADRLEAGKKIPKERRSSYQAAIDKKGELTEEKERLEALLAEVERQIELNSIHIQHEGRSMKQPFSEVQATTQECHRQRAEVERHLSIKRKCMEDNETLDEHLSTFRRSVKRRLDSARQDSSSKADPQVDLQDCQTSIEEHSQIVPQRTPELFFPEASEPRPRGLLIRLAEISMAVFARCFCC
ncbi:hypothetical protein BT93_E1945 [Corymbia citriodora subsp. variegata]|nr:hypothetical protein BT93_E1945 [Corymbia citriodora subsp. variegata]